MKGHKTRMSGDTFNLVVAAGVLVLVAVVTVLIMQIGTRKSCETDRVADTTRDPVGETVEYRLTDVRAGPFVLPSTASPWREEEVAAVEAATLPMQAANDKEVPYIVAKPSLRARPETLFAIRQMAEDMPATEGVALRIERGYLSYAEAGMEAGVSPYHTGYFLTLSFLVSGEGTLSLSQAVKHPVAASPAAWLCANLPLYGFIRTGSESSEVHYVGLPHASLMTGEALDRVSYLARVRAASEDAPLICSTAGGVQHVFYVKADYGVAVIRASARASVIAVGDGERGFVVTLYYPNQ